jgi:hypothetical protein
VLTARGGISLYQTLRNLERSDETPSERCFLYACSPSNVCIVLGANCVIGKSHLQACTPPLYSISMLMCVWKHGLLLHRRYRILDYKNFV